VERPADVDDAVVQEKAVRQQRRAEDEVGDGQSFHARVNGAHRVVADDRQAAPRQDEQRQEVADDADDADGRNEDGLHRREATGARPEQPRRRAAAELELVAEGGDVERRRVDWPNRIVGGVR